MHDAEALEIAANRIKLRDYVRDYAEFDMGNYIHCIGGCFLKCFGLGSSVGFGTPDDGPTKTLGLPFGRSFADLIMPRGWTVPGARPKSQALDVLDQLIATGNFTWPAPATPLPKDLDE